MADEEGAPQALPQVVEDALNGQSNEANTLEALCGVVNIDDDNDPAPEIIPVPTDNSDRVLNTEWKHHGHCFRQSVNMANHKACLNFCVDQTRDDYFIQLFEGLFPMEVIQCIIDSVNDKLISERRLTHGEVLQWIGLWVLISTLNGSDQHAFWSMKKVNVFDGAPFRVTPYMSRCRFELILYNLGYTKVSTSEQGSFLGGEADATGIEQEYGHELLPQLDKLHRREHVQIGEGVHVPWLHVCA